MNLPAASCRVSNINCPSLDGLVRLRWEGIKGHKRKLFLLRRD